MTGSAGECQDRCEAEANLVWRSPFAISDFRNKHHLFGTESRLRVSQVASRVLPSPSHPFLAQDGDESAGREAAEEGEVHVSRFILVAGIDENPGRPDPCRYRK